MKQASSLRTRICAVLRCDYPVVSAGMGGIARAELVASVLSAAGYVLLGMVRESPNLFRPETAAVRERADRAFCRSGLRTD